MLFFVNCSNRELRAYPESPIIIRRYCGIGSNDDYDDDDDDWQIPTHTAYPLLQGGVYVQEFMKCF